MKFFFLLTFSILSACASVPSIDNPFDDERPAEASSAPSPLIIDVLDIGQGDATLVIGPNHKTLLIDAGPPGQGIATVLPRLAALEIEALDWIVATHYDADHIGGIPEVLKGTDQILGTDDDVVPKQGLLDRGDATDKATALYKEYVAATQTFRKPIAPGFIFDLGLGATAEVIVVNGEYSDGRHIHLNPDEENEACIGILIRYGTFTYFTAGDLTGGGSPGGYETKDMETIAGEIIGDIDVLHVGHHGSGSSSNEAFLKEVTPEAVLISVGKDNDYGHPTAEVLARIQEAGAAVYRTDQLGTIEIETDGEAYAINY